MAVAPQHDRASARCSRTRPRPSPGTVRETPGLPAGELSRRVGTRVRAQGGEPAGHRLVQGARRHELHPPAVGRRRARGRRGGGQRRQPRAGRGVRGALRRVASAARDARARFTREGRGGAPVRRRGRVRGRRLRRGAGRGGAPGSQRRRDARGARLRPARGGGGPGHGRARDRPAGAGHAAGRGAARRRRPRRRDRTGARDRAARRRAWSACRPRAARPTSTRWRPTGPSARARPTRSATASRSSAPATTRSRSWSATSTRS